MFIPDTHKKIFTMQKILSLLTLILLFSDTVSSQVIESQLHQAELRQLKQEVTKDLRGNILPFWITRMTDNTRGGFYGRIDGKNVVYPDAVKGGILNARILWTFSSAYRITGDTLYLRMAVRAKDYILNHFIDREQGGAFLSLKADGTPSDTRKQVYTNAFFIYALSEYSRATGDMEPAAEAMKIFELFENHALDIEKNGYFEVFSREWLRLRDRMIGESSDKDEKTMNTHLHVMEAYANLYRVTGNKIVGERLRNLVGIFLDKIIDKKTSHLICFMDRDWNSTSTIDSYGHDIESSWLLYEAAALINDEELTKRVKAAVIKIADAAAEGYQKDGSMLTEKNYSTGHIRLQRSWWEQAETVVGYLNAYELTGNVDYLDRSTDCWNYIKTHFIDAANGGWFSYVSENGVPSGDKGGFWICPYHNGRMCMEVMERVRE
jgi:mannobiose 2-epimerase